MKKKIKNTLTKRLVWNFEIVNNHLLNWQKLPATAKDRIHWETRFFWPEDSIINLIGLADTFLDLTNYEIKGKKDLYILCAQSHFNIKQRRAQLLYKPLIKEKKSILGYGEKINLTDYPLTASLPGTANWNMKKMLLFLQSTKKINVAVNKEALIYKFTTIPSVRLELARLQVNGRTFFTACIEGRSCILVRQISDYIFAAQKPCDYVNFLKLQSKLLTL